MNYLFVSEDCLSCSMLLKVLGEKDSEKWTRCLTLVYVKSNNNNELKTYIKNEEVGESPVSKVPALYVDSSKELLVGGEHVFGELSNVNWFC
jgi:hypothetical protein